MKNKVQAKIVDCLAIAKAHFKMNFDMPSIEYYSKGTCAGKANALIWCVKLNETLLKENTDHFINQTVPHEVAHLIANQVYGFSIKSHGKEWKFVMRLFGLSPDIYHKYDVTNVRVRNVKREYAYKCNCRIAMLTSIRHKRSMQGHGFYVCKDCKSKLVYVEA